MDVALHVENYVVMRLLPREEKFFEYFLSQARLISQAAHLLLDGTQAGNSHIAEAADKIRLLEGKGDEIIHEIFRLLNTTFITPLDPEDLHSLSSHLDDVLDGIEDAAHRIVSYHINPIPPTVVHLCGHIVSCAKALEMAFEALNKNEKLLEHCIEINRIEEEVDNHVRQAVQELFENEKDPIQIMKLKEVYELLEQTTDYCEDVADALQNVVVKNS
jgi:predicted phosphate transport protein (TIGR00153 family)